MLCADEQCNESSGKNGLHASRTPPLGGWLAVQAGVGRTFPIAGLRFSGQGGLALANRRHTLCLQVLRSDHAVSPGKAYDALEPQQYSSLFGNHFIQEWTRQLGERRPIEWIREPLPGMSACLRLRIG